MSVTAIGWDSEPYIIQTVRHAQLAKLIVDIATGEIEDRAPSSPAGPQEGVQRFTSRPAIVLCVRHPYMFAKASQ